jgi:hypothetical protein
MERSQSIVAFLSGIIVALGGALLAQSGLPEAKAQTSGSGQQMFAVTGSGTQGQSRDVLFLIKPDENRLAVYEYKDGVLALAAMRNTEFEFRFQEWSPQGKQQRPSVAEMRKNSEESGADKAGGKGG